MKLYRSATATLIFFIALVLIYYVHVTFIPVNVVFYAAIADGFIAVVIGAVCLFAFVLFKELSGFEKLQLIMIWLLAGYAFAISVPTVIDRSLSLYILEKLQQRGGGIKQESMGEVFTQEYLAEFRLIDVRLTEQLESGTIVIKNGCVILTEKGERIASFSRYFRKNWLPKKRLLMGRYSDDLVDPFKHGRSLHSYACKQ